MMVQARVAIVFDWNGTVIDDVLRARRATNVILRERGLAPLSKSEFAASFELPLRSFFSRRGVIDADAAVEAWGASMAGSSPTPARGALSVIQHLAEYGAVVGVVTAAPWGALAHDLAAVSLAGDITYAAAGVEQKSRVLGEMRSGFDRMIYVGDTQFDVFEARKAGIGCIAIAGSGYSVRASLERAEPLTIVNGLAEAETFLNTFLQPQGGEDRAW